MTQTIKLWLYPGANPNSASTAWAPYETDITQYVRRPGQDGGQPISYSWGKQNESTQTDYGSMSLTLDNRDGRFSTDKIDGPWYGILDTNTPIRLGVVSGTDSFTRTVGPGTGVVAGWGGGWANANAGVGSSTYAVDGSKGTINTTGAGVFTASVLTGTAGRDVDAVSRVVPLINATGASYGIGHAFRYTDANNYIWSTVEFNVAGDVTVKIRRRYLGVETELAAINPIPSSTYTIGSAWMLHSQVEGDVVRAKAWPASGTEPADWMITATDEDNAGTGVANWAARFTGNTNGTVNFVALDSYTVTAFEWTGFVVSWPQRWDITGANSWVPITCGGILRRLRQGTNPTVSPLRRQLGGTANTTGYWPLEDGSDAKYFTPYATNIAVATYAGVTPAADNTLPGGGPAPTMNADTSTIRAQTRFANNGNGMSAMVFFKVPSMPASKTRIIRIRTSRGPAPIWDFSIQSSLTTIEALAADGTVLSSQANAPAFDFSGKWVAYQLETDNSGGNTAWSSLYHEVDVDAPFYFQSGTVTGGTNTNVSSIELGGISGTAYAHIWMGRNTLPFVDSNFANVSAGYDGETAARRFIRICGEAGIPCSVAGPSSILDLTTPMGPQKDTTTMAGLQACADADFGVIAERGAGLEFIPRLTRWNVAQFMTLSKAAGHIAQIPEPTRDDQSLRNKWTVSRTNGGSSSYSDQTSINRNGTWEDSATLNVYDDSVLQNQAAWRVYIGTGKRLRWPSIAINLARNPSLAEYWRKRFYGWRFGVTTGLTQVKGNEPDLVMEGFSASLDPDNWTVEMNATDARIWAAGVTDDTGILGRADNEYCTTTALISSTALTIPITTGTVSGANMPKWDATAALWSGGVDFNVGGERVTVTSITNGAGQAQTLNVTVRGVDGYAASHPSGTSVSLWYPPIVAL